MSKNSISENTGAGGFPKTNAEIAEEKRNATYTPQIPPATVFVLANVIPERPKGGIMAGKVLSEDEHGVPVRVRVQYEVDGGFKTKDLTNEGEQLQFTIN